MCGEAAETEPALILSWMEKSTILTLDPLVLR